MTMNKALFLGLMSAFLVASTPSFAKETIDLQKYVTCGLMNCTLAVDVNELPLNKAGKDLILSLNNENKNAYLSTLPDTIKEFSISTKDHEKLIVTAKITPASQNYWYLEFADFILDPWFNSSLPYCNNLSYFYRGAVNYTNRIVRFNITNMTGFNYDDGHDVVFVNDTYNSTGALTELPFAIFEYAANAWFYGFIRLDHIEHDINRNISYCYGNNTTSRSNANLVFNYASVNDSVFDDFDGTSLNATAWNNISTVSVASGTLTLSGSGAWHEVYSESTFNTSYVFITNVSVNDVTGNSRAFGEITPSGSAPLNAFQLGYPTASYFNYRNYISGENSATTGNNIATAYQIFENYRNNTYQIGSKFYSINHSMSNNFTGTQILNTARLFGYQVLTAGDDLNIGWAIIWFNPNPEPAAAYYYNQFNQTPITMNAVVDDTIVCFKTQPVCIRLSDRFLWRKNYNVIV